MDTNRKHLNQIYFYWLFVISLQLTSFFSLFLCFFLKKTHTHSSFCSMKTTSLSRKFSSAGCDHRVWCCFILQQKWRKRRTRPKNQTLGAAEPRQLTKTGAKSQNKVVNLKKLWSPQTNQKGPAWNVHHEKNLMTCVPTQPFSMFECPITDVLPGRKRFIMPKRLRCFSWKLKSVSFKWV